MQSNRYRDWLSSAHEDLLWGEDSFAGGHFSQTCFIAQQIAEKSLKALAYFRKYDLVKSHSVRKLAEELEINGDLREPCRILDQYYITARYPDALPEGTPGESFTGGQAAQALEYARNILDRVEKETQNP
jgi:HEPN domain-containing protein